MSSLDAWVVPSPAPDAIDPLECVTRPQLAALLKVADETVSAMVPRGELPRPFKLGAKALRWRRADVLAALERLEQRTAS